MQVYEVIVTSSSYQYSVWRRFREFAALRKHILSLFKLPLETLCFPRRRLFNNRAVTVRSFALGRSCSSFCRERAALCIGGEFSQAGSARFHSSSAQDSASARLHSQNLLSATRRGFGNACGRWADSELSCRAAARVRKTGELAQRQRQQHAWIGPARQRDLTGY